MVKEINPEAVNFFEILLIDKGVGTFLDSLKKHHKETYEHGYRVGLRSIHLGFINGESTLEKALLGYTGLLHDYGKIHIPETILGKKSILTEEERKIIDGHPRLGFLRLSEPEYDDVRRILIAHHEYKIGAYPRCGKDRRKHELVPRLRKDRRKRDPRICRLAQMTAVADIYDALASKRAYKPGLPIDEVERILRQQYTGNPIYIDQILGR